MKRMKLTVLSDRARLLSETWAFAQIISRGSGATVTSKIRGLLVNGVLAAQVTDVRSRNVTKPVDDIVAPTTPSKAESV